jgi:hypothetical protein
MRPHSLITDRSLACLFITGLLVFGPTPAKATYTVIDDDLYPTTVIEARSAPQKQVLPEHYMVPFQKDRSPLDSSGRAVLASLIPHMRNASIRIVGRPDAMIYKTGKLGIIAQNRAINIRDYLTRQGVPASSITFEIDNTPNPQPNGSSYPCDIYITVPDAVAPSPSTVNYVSRYEQPQPITQPSQLPPALTYPPTQAYAPTKTTTTLPAADPLVQYINQAVQSGQMQPAVALDLLRTLMESTAKHGGQQLSQQPAAQITLQRPQAPEPAPQFVATPSLVRNENWVLDNKLTLRDNVDAWSKLAGWKPSVWEAANYYQVTTTTKIGGGFPDVLRKIADSTGLNICAKTREKYVRITDANMPCK